MEMNAEILTAILDAYSYELIFVDRQHIVRFMNAEAKRKYGDAVRVGQSLFNCHNGSSRGKIESFLARADTGENEMFEVFNGATGEREFFVPVRDRNGEVIGYFERHEEQWSAACPDRVVRSSY